VAGLITGRIRPRLGSEATTRKDVILAVIVVAVLAAAAIVYGTSGRGDNPDADFPEGHPYLCRDCGALTILTSRELYDLKAKARESDESDATRIPCAKCGSRNTEVAIKCPRCGEYVIRPGAGRPVCTHCKQPFPSPLSGKRP